MSKRTVFLAGWLLMGLLATQPGCTSKPAGLPAGPVKGAVSLDGKPVANAQVWFTPEAGESSFGKTDAGGHYELALTVGEEPRKGAIVGKHQVRVVTGAPEPSTGGTTNTEVPLSPMNSTVEYKFAEPVSVGEKENQIDLDLKTAIKRKG